VAIFSGVATGLMVGFSQPSIKIPSKEPKATYDRQILQSIIVFSGG
jgi:hypothetical protein